VLVAAVTQRNKLSNQMKKPSQKTSPHSSNFRHEMIIANETARNKTLSSTVTCHAEDLQEAHLF
jgi:hypothetical protein